MKYKVIYCVFIIMILGLLGFGRIGYANLEDGLVGYYPFNGNANDESGNGNHGNIYGAIFVEGKFGYGLEFADVNHTYVEIPHSASLTPSNAITICLWAKVYNYSTWHGCLVYKAGDEPTSDGFSDRCYTLWATQNLGVHFTSTAEGESSQTRCDTSDNLYELNKFTHFTAIVDTTNHIMKIFINGNLVQSCEYNGDSIRGGAYPLRIGGPFLTLSDQSGFNGVIDEVRIYNRPLSDPEIMLLATPKGSPGILILLLSD